MKKTLNFCSALALLLFVTLQAFSQGKERSVDTFDKIEVSGAIDVKITQAPNQRLALEGDEEALERIETFVRHGTLIIRREDDSNWWTSWWKDHKDDNIIAYISVPALSGISVSGASDIEGNGTFKASHMKLDASGASDIHLNVEVDQLDIDASGASDMHITTRSTKVMVECSGASEIQLTGSATDFVAKASGASDIKARELQVKNCSVDASGAGSCYIAVSESIKAHASGGSSVYYYGEPERVAVSSSGGGSIKKRSL